MKRLTISLVAVSALSGCTLLTPLGEPFYNCNRLQTPDSPYCHSVRSVEQGTNGTLPESRYDEKFSIEEAYRLNGIALPQGKDTRDIELYNPNTGAMQRGNGANTSRGNIQAAIPVREGPVVQRVWVKGWVDDSDNLHDSTVVYREIRGNRWSGYATASKTQAATSSANGLYPHRRETTTEKNSTQVEPTTTPLASNEFVQPGSTQSGQISNVSAVTDTSLPH